MFCAACRLPILPGQEIQLVPPVMVVFVGEKSGQALLAQANPNEQQEIVHLSCAGQYFDPEFNATAYEELRKQIEDDLVEEKMDSLREAAWDEVRRSAHKICVDCLEERREEELVLVPGEPL